MEFNIEEMGIEDISLDSKGNTLPNKNDLVALIDADTLVFAACLNNEYEVDLLPEEMYTEDELLYIKSLDTYSEEFGVYKDINLDQAYQEALNRIEEILGRTGCVTYELHFTEGRKSFRYDYYKDYKANRMKDSSKKPPAGLKELKSMLTKNNGFIHFDFEADDIVVMKKLMWPEKYMLIAVDKDVLYSLPGTHFNYYSSSLYKIDMKFIEVDEETAMKHHYMQTLTGDTSDNIPGLYRVGKKTAEKILKHCKTPGECWDKVIEEYEKRGKTGLDAIVSMRLVNMQQLEYINNEWKVKLWKPE